MNREFRNMRIAFRVVSFASVICFALCIYGYWFSGTFAYYAGWHTFIMKFLLPSSPLFIMLILAFLGGVLYLPLLVLFVPIFMFCFVPYPYNAMANSVWDAHSIAFPATLSAWSIFIFQFTADAALIVFHIDNQRYKKKLKAFQALQQTQTVIEQSGDNQC